MGDDVLAYMLDNYDAVVIESYGVGGIPTNSKNKYFEIIQESLKKGKTIVITTQVPNEGSDLNVYKVGNILKNKVKVIEAYDMIIEAATCKLMWILGQTSEPDKIRTLFYTTISNDIMY
jgi:L-asparaginase